MNAGRTRSALLILQWTLGLVLVAESALFAFSPGAANAFAKTGMPSFVRPVLAWTEIGAAILFFIPRTVIAGGWPLMVVLGFAIVLHLLHGWFNVGSLIVYAVAAWTVMAGTRAPS